MFLPENPIQTVKDDFLGRQKFTEHFAKSLSDWNESESLVIALYGAWGSGKTSLLNMAIECLKSSHLKDKNYERIT
jgi:predicted KAP-like P-loop ATPase